MSVGTIDKTVGSLAEAVAGIGDGATIMVGGFGDSGIPEELLAALVRHGAGELTLIANNAGSGEGGVAALLREGRVRRIVCSFPRSSGSVWFERRYRAGEVELEIVPQGTLSERIRAGGAGIAAFYVRTGAGTKLAEGHETRNFDGVDYVLWNALHADVALVRAKTADALGNLVYDKTARNFNPDRATAGKLVIAQIDEIVPVGTLDPELIATPHLLVDHLVLTGGN